MMDGRRRERVILQGEAFDDLQQLVRKLSFIRGQVE